MSTHIICFPQEIRKLFTDTHSYVDLCCSLVLSVLLLQSNLDGSNTNGSFTMANSNSSLSPYEILPIAQENKYLMTFSYFIVKLYVVCTH